MPTPDTLPWDASRPYQSRPDASQDFYNTGCPVGYFAQAVPANAPDATDYGNPVAGMRCRLIDTTTPETQVAEAAGDLTLAYENAGRFNLAAVNATEFPWAMAGVAALGLLVYQRMQKGKK